MGKGISQTQLAFRINLQSLTHATEREEKNTTEQRAAQQAQREEEEKQYNSAQTNRHSPAVLMDVEAKELLPIISIKFVKGIKFSHNNTTAKPTLVQV